MRAAIDNLEHAKAQHVREDTTVFQFGREPAIPFDEFIRRTVAFALYEGSGFLTYDLAGVLARAEHRLSCVGPWTVLLATTLGVQVRGRAVRSMVGSLEQFADLLHAIPCGKDLHALAGFEKQRVTAFCRFHVPYVRRATVTKIGALYRPRAIPIVDSKIAKIYGGTDDQVVDGLAEDIGRQFPQLQAAQAKAAVTAPDLASVSLLRFCDIGIWTTLYDRRTKDDTETWLATPWPANPKTRRAAIGYYPVEEDPPVC